MLPLLPERYPLVAAAGIHIQILRIRVEKKIMLFFGLQLILQDLL